MSRFPVACLILAAGAATRMGKLKQLLPFRGKPLVRHVIERAHAAGFKPIVVVVGAEADAVRAAIATEPVEIVENRRWARGMGSSIAAGMRELQAEQSEAAAVAILLADQPLVTAEGLSAMREALIQGAAEIVAAEYEGVVGVPALFRRLLFRRLAMLPAEAGARQLVRSPGLQVLPFPMPEAGVDVDTPEDYAGLDPE